jgi:aldose 1-epimerase
VKKLGLKISLCVLFMATSYGCAAQPYSIETHGDVVQLRDTGNDTVVSVLTPVNNPYEMVVNGKNVIRMNNVKSVDDMRARPGLNGVPLMAPFANRLDEPAFYANGKKYYFDTELGNIRAPIPIHGYLTNASTWEVIDSGADANSAWVTSKMDFYKVPDYMAQFPFAHTLTVTYRLSGGALEVHTRIDNLSTEPMPNAIGYHPYFQLTDSGRNDWTLNAPAKTHWLLDNRNVPSGITQPAEDFWGTDPHNISLSAFSETRIDDVFTDLERDSQGRSTFTMSGEEQSISVTVGPNYKTMLVYSTAPQPPREGGSGNRPSDVTPVSTGPDVPLSATEGEPAPWSRGFIALEPMVGITNSMNMARKGLYDELQYIQPGGSWEESFWISTEGF